MNKFPQLSFVLQWKYVRDKILNIIFGFVNNGCSRNLSIKGPFVSEKSELIGNVSLSLIMLIYKAENLKKKRSYQVIF